MCWIKAAIRYHQHLSHSASIPTKKKEERKQSEEKPLMNLHGCALYFLQAKSCIDTFITKKIQSLWTRTPCAAEARLPETYCPTGDKHTGPFPHPPPGFHIFLLPEKAPALHGDSSILRRRGGDGLFKLGLLLIPCEICTQRSGVGHSETVRRLLRLTSLKPRLLYEEVSCRNSLTPHMTPSLKIFSDQLTLLLSNWL